MLQRIQRKQLRREHRNRSRLASNAITLVVLTTIVVGVLMLSRSCDSDVARVPRQAHSALHAN
jgi:hypothetical protein